ncbi:MAG: excinuclease ABC subunit C, partial [Aliifodinibius sp.]|nr:excinuclease ABC subunit C [Fodinibius sp.]NIV10421.1 excinuclease ABC subunit C [Fodinibius sp.]NIY24084.1 excinuclease ABC subunit C [Fodinibius sp.]
SERQDYERAAQFRDQISNLRRVQEHQYISGGQSNVDIIASATNDDIYCVTVIFIRGGLNIGSKSWFPKQSLQTIDGN